MTVRIVPLLHLFSNELIQFDTTHVRLVRWHSCNSSNSSGSSIAVRFTCFFFHFIRILLSRISSNKKGNKLQI